MRPTIGRTLPLRPMPIAISCKKAKLFEPPWHRIVLLSSMAQVWEARLTFCTSTWQHYCTRCPYDSDEFQVSMIFPLPDKVNNSVRNARLLYHVRNVCTYIRTYVCTNCLHSILLFFPWLYSCLFSLATSHWLRFLFTPYKINYPLTVYHPRPTEIYEPTWFLF